MRIKIICFLTALTLVSCRVNRAYVPGQEGLETVYEKKQVRAELDIVNTPGKGAIHTSVAYSPIKNIGLLYDLKTSGSQYMYNSLALGYYFASYKRLELIAPNMSKSYIDVGSHFDFYAGASYGFANNAMVPFLNNFTSFPTITKDYEINQSASRYFIQTGAHLKGKHLNFDFTLRKVWLNVHKVDIFGLGPGTDINPIEDFKNSSVIGFTEMGFKMSLLSDYKVCYFGLAYKMGQGTPFVESAYLKTNAFIGINLDIVNLFSKKAPRRPEMEYKFAE